MAERRWAQAAMRQAGHGGATAAHVAYRIGRPQQVVRSALLALVDDGLVAVSGGDRFALTAEGVVTPSLTRPDPDW